MREREYYIVILRTIATVLAVAASTGRARGRTRAIPNAYCVRGFTVQCTDQQRNARPLSALTLRVGRARARPLVNQWFLLVS